MPCYAIGSFKPSRSGSPHQFVSTDLQPKGPFAKLDLKRLRINQAQFDWVHHAYLFELEDLRSADQRVQYVTRIIASLKDISRKVHDALFNAKWEMVVLRGRRQFQLVGSILKTEFGYFEPQYHSGLNAFGPGQDVDPFFEVHACPGSVENPYGDALRTELAQRYLPCFDEAEIKRALDTGSDKEDLGELF